MLRSLKIITHIYSMSAGEKTSRNWSPISVPRGLVAFRNENITNCFPHWLPLILYCTFLVKTLFDVTCSSLYREEVISLTKGNGARHKNTNVNGTQWKPDDQCKMVICSYIL